MEPIAITLIGRPNVGKSTLFNRLTGTRRAIVTSVPGTTRDRREGSFVWNGMVYRLFDTGGLFAQETELFQAEILRQCQAAIAESAVVWLMVDGRDGLTPVDQHLMAWLRPQGKPIWVLVNKLDSPRMLSSVGEFYQLGADHVWGLSVETGLGLGDMLDALTDRWPSQPAAESETEPDIPRIVIVGRPNVGKSSLINRLLGYERVIVSDIPGTTRDVIDVEWRWNGHRWILLDTAGHKKRARARDWPERVSLIMMRRALERAHIVWLVLDATQPVARRDRQLAGWSLQAGKGLIVLLNKTDLIPSTLRRDVEQRARASLNFVPYAPILHVSAKTGEGVLALIETTETVWQAMNHRIRTSVLNRYLDEEANRVIGMVRGRPIRLKYITQVEVRPPQFALFLSRPTRVRPEHVQKIEKWIRQQFPFIGTPLRLFVANKSPKPARVG